jgi:hypothetical protein
MTMHDRAQPRELTDELLDLVVGGAGNPAPELLQRLLREGILPPPPSPASA